MEREDAVVPVWLTLAGASPVEGSVVPSCQREGKGLSLLGHLPSGKCMKSQGFDPGSCVILCQESQEYGKHCWSWFSSFRKYRLPRA